MGVSIVCIMFHQSRQVHNPFSLFLHYTDPNKEKELRSTLKSELQRLVSQDSLLIFDGGNYIKGIKSHFLYSITIAELFIKFQGIAMSCTVYLNLTKLLSAPCTVILMWRKPGIRTWTGVKIVDTPGRYLMPW